MATVKQATAYILLIEGKKNNYYKANKVDLTGGNGGKLQITLRDNDIKLPLTQDQMFGIAPTTAPK
jgi:hypothetical protein